MLKVHLKKSKSEKCLSSMIVSGIHNVVFYFLECTWENKYGKFPNHSSPKPNVKSGGWETADVSPYID